MKNFKKLASKIVKENVNCIFISPHLDDAAISAGALMSRLSKTNSVRVVNVFTNATHDKPTLSAKAYLRQCGASDAVRLFADRVSEDKVALKKYDVKVANLDFTDAMWRKVDNPSKLRRFISKFIPEFAFTHPTYRWHVLAKNKAQNEQGLRSKIEDKLTKETEGSKNYVVFTSIADSGHVDHEIVRDICSKLFVQKVIFWSDISYSKKADISTFVNNKKLTRSMFVSKSDRKNKMLMEYKTQIGPIYPNGIPNANEIYYHSLGETGHSLMTK